MHSIGYVILPESMELDRDTISSFIKKQTAKYSNELEVEPWLTMKYSKE